MTRKPRDAHDSLTTFREYMQLERRRVSGLSPSDWDRWQSLRKRLDDTFGGLEMRDGVGHSRATLRIPTSLVVSFDNLVEMGRLLLSNLSRGGMFVPTEQPAELGTRLRLRIEVASPHREIELDGEVVSRNVGPAFQIGKRGMGIRFKTSNETDQRLVDELYEQQFERHLRSD